MVIEAATARPSTEIGNSHDRQPSPATDARARMCSYEATAATPATDSTATVVTRPTHIGTSSSASTSSTGATTSTGDGAGRSADAPLRRSIGNAICAAAISPP
jgi:hypothetical protein